MEFEIPEYSRRIILAMERNAERFPKGGAVIHHFVFHDNCCPLLLRGEACNCAPDVEVEIEGYRYRILPEGRLVAVGLSAGRRLH